MRVATALFILFLAACGTRNPEAPFSPEESIKMMRVEAGYRVEPVVSEPAIVSPVALDIDEDGRWWVVEDRGYPLNVSKVGRIKLLEDTNGDGVPDKSTIFADNLMLPTGIMRWKKGVLVTDAPDLLYLEDTDGDGKADIRKPLLTGFAFTNPQHTVNGLVFGLDNWIYIAHENPTTAIIFADKFGDRGSEIHWVDRPDAPPLKERGRNIRFQPDTGKLEALSGTSQFGHAFDEFGHHFVLNNTFHARHEVIAAQYLKRNPDLPLASATEEMSDHGRPAKVFPLVARQRVEMLTNVGEFTSACGMLYYMGGAFPDTFRHSALVAEPAHNLVHRDIFVPAGATFSAKRSREGEEFIASTDPWFRPVNFYTGPDGAIYMLDYYRLVIEHPEWMATGLDKSQELTAGMDKGRIYRIVPDGKPIERARQLKLGQASTAELVDYLGHPNIWWRRTAQRLLMDRKPTDAAPLVAKLLNSQSAVARVHALWTLDGLGKLENAHIEKALKDPDSGIRETAIRLSEGRTSLPLTVLADDPDARVRFQLLATLGFQNTPEARAVRDRILFRDIEDRWVQVAALSAGSAEAGRLFAAAASQKSPESKGRAQFFQQAAAVIAARKNPAEIQSTLAQVRTGSGWWQPAALDGLAQGLRSGVPPTVKSAAQAPLLALFEGPNAATRRAALRVLETTGFDGSTDRFLKVGLDKNADAALRADAIGLASLSDAAAKQAEFQQLLDAKEPEAVQMAACRAMGRITGPATAEFLIKNWKMMTPAVRMEAADAIYRDPSRVPTVLAALKSGGIAPWTLAFRHKRQLQMHKDPTIREAARALFEAGAGQRDEVIKKYQTALDLKPDASRGKQVFEQICKKCHRLEGIGAEVGPDLATVRGQPKQALLTDILDPSRSISQGFEAYVVDTANGGTIDGVLGPQTPATITLRHEEGKEDLIQRKDIREMRVTNLSAMPGDLEKQVDPQQMADLLEYVKTAKP